MYRVRSYLVNLSRFDTAYSIYTRSETKNQYSRRADLTSNVGRRGRHSHSQSISHDRRPTINDAFRNVNENVPRTLSSRPGCLLPSTCEKVTLTLPQLTHLCAIELSLDNSARPCLLFLALRRSLCCRLLLYTRSSHSHTLHPPYQPAPRVPGHSRPHAQYSTHGVLHDP